MNLSTESDGPVLMYRCGVCSTYTVGARCFQLAAGIVCADCVEDVYQDLTSNRPKECKWYSRGEDGGWTSSRTRTDQAVRVWKAVVLESNDRIDDTSKRQKPPVH